MRFPKVSLATVKSRWRAAKASMERQSRTQHRDLGRNGGWKAVSWNGGWKAVS